MAAPTDSPDAVRGVAMPTPVPGGRDNGGTALSSRQRERQEGAVAGMLETWLRRLLAARRGAPPTLPATGHGHRLVGGPAALSRVLMVPASTVALLLRAGQPVELRAPGELLAPPLLGPVATQPVVLVVVTTPVRLEVTVLDGITFDGYPLDRVTLQLSVEVEPDEGFGRLRQLAAEHGVGLEAGLLTGVQREVAAAVRGALRMNRLADLQRLSLQEVLRNRWWPASFAGGALRCSEFEVRQVGWPGGSSSSDEPTVPLPVGAL